MDTKDMASETCTRESCDRFWGYTPPQFNLAFVFRCVLCAAVWMAGFRYLAPGSLAVVAVIELTWLFGCARTKRGVYAVVPCLFIPFTWVLWETRYGDSYASQWARMFFQLPGLIGEIPFHQLPQPAFEISTAITTVILFLILVTLARFRPRWTLIVAILTLAIGSLLSILAYQLYRM
ncbi:MAG: hypothetical protein U0905_00415 [Pirellulales bacterium]